MAYWYDYGIAVGHDNADGLVNFEDYFTVPLRAENRVPLGAVVRQTLDRKRHYNGARRVALTQAACQFSELEAYVDAVHGGWDGGDAEVTLRFRRLDNAFANFNAIAHMPIENEHYRHETTAAVVDVRLEFDIIGDLADPDPDPDPEPEPEPE